MGVAALRVGLPELDHGVRDRGAGAVEDPALDTDAFALGIGLAHRARGDAGHGIVVLLRRQAVGEVRADGLRRRLLQRHGSALHRRGVAATQHDVEDIAQREARLGDVDRELRHQELARRPAWRCRSDRAAAADRRGNASASPAASGSSSRTARSGCAPASRRCDGWARDSARLDGHEPVAASASLTQRPPPKKFGSSGASCWSTAWT